MDCSFCYCPVENAAPAFYNGNIKSVLRCQVGNPLIPAVRARVGINHELSDLLPPSSPTGALLRTAAKVGQTCQQAEYHHDYDFLLHFSLLPSVLLKYVKQVIHLHSRILLP